MARLKRLIGEKFGRLTVVSLLDERKHRYCAWLCHCTCGNDSVVTTSNLTMGRTKSCGCLRNEARTIAGKIQGKRNVSHGLTNSREYSSWLAMKQRCLTPNNPKYPRYGGRGITICDSWVDSFQNFYNDMGERPHSMTIERVDNDGSSSPDTIFWATATMQARNRSNSNRNRKQT